jgi:DNA-binding transcriptional MerR regulator
MSEPYPRICALSERVGVSPDLLRAWAHRYGLLQPTRSDGGFRLYSSADAQRVRTMRRHLDAGVSAAQAARLALAETCEDETMSSSVPTALPGQPRAALDRFDEPGLTSSIGCSRLPPSRPSSARSWFPTCASSFAGVLLGLARGWGTARGGRA